MTGLLHGDTSQFLLQLGGATLCAVYAFGLTFVVFKVVNAVRSMRVSKEVELEGLDVPEFGMLAYPEEEGNRPTDGRPIATPLATGKKLLRGQ